MSGNVAVRKLDDVPDPTKESDFSFRGVSALAHANMSATWVT
jgi:hypothetical protein